MKYRLTSEQDDDASTLDTIADDLGLSIEDKAKLSTAPAGSIISVASGETTHDILVLDGEPTIESEEGSESGDSEGN